MRALRALPRWSLVVPPASLLLTAATWGRDLPLALVAVVAVVLGLAVVTAVHHAEVVAHQVGEPFGTLILALAVTVIEVGLIATLMSSGGEDAQTLARDTIFSAVMVTLNLVVGLSLIVGAVKHRVMRHNVQGAAGALAVTLLLATLSLVLPQFTTSSSGPTFSSPQLFVVGILCFVLYASFVFVQTIRHRDYFLPIVEPERPDATADIPADAGDHATAPGAQTAWVSVVLLLMCLVSVVGLAKTVSPALKGAVTAVGAPIAVVGVVIACVVLAPETVAAVRAARRRRMQTSFNLAYGSANASIGLTIPSIAVVAWLMDTPLQLGLSPTEMALLSISAALSILTINSGKATVLQGVVHLVTFLAFLLVSFAP